MLEARGAAFRTADPGAAVAELLLTENLRVHRITSTPGWRDGVFVAVRGFTRMSDGMGQEILARVADESISTDIGHTSGSSEGWRREVGALARQSRFMAFGILVALAAPLAGDCGLPEGVLFNFWADSSTGKTTVMRVAASVSGDPNLIAKWNTTKRGSEELAAGHNGYALILDDTETAADELATLMRSVTHVITSGRSKTYSASVQDRLPPLTWSCFGLSTSPESMSALARRKGQQRSAGEKVRLVDLPVPDPSEGGVFDRLDPGIGAINAQALAVIDKLRLGIARHHGTLFLDWLDVLDDVSPGEVRKRIAAFEAATPARDGLDGRLLRKFAVVRVAGDFAVEHGILDWSPEFVAEVVDAMLAAARAELRGEASRKNEGWERLRAALDDPRRTLPLGSTISDGPSRGRLVAVRSRHKGIEIVGVFGPKVRALFDGNLSAFLDPLRARGALIREPGRTDTGTIQLSPIERRNGLRPWRPRAYAVRPDALADVLASQCAAEGTPRSDDEVRTRDAAAVANHARRSRRRPPGSRVASARQTLGAPTIMRS